MYYLPAFHPLLLTLVITLVSLLTGPQNCTLAAGITDTGQRPVAPAVLGGHNDISVAKRFPTTAESLYSSPIMQKKISAGSAIIIDAKSGRPLFAKSPDSPRQPASTIKVLTGMIAIDTLRGSEPVPVSSEAAGQPRSKIDLQPDRHYQAEDLINAVLLGSANDASVALAERIAGSESSFAQMMTQRAARWGAQQTICKTATGLTAKGQTSTARDLAIIFRQAMFNTDFATRMKQRKIRTADGALIYNHNKALWQIEGTEGGKTGYTNAARQTYVGKFKRGSTEIIIAIMGSETIWSDIRHLVRYGFTLGQYLPPANDLHGRPPELIAERSTGSLAEPVHF